MSKDKKICPTCNKENYVSAKFCSQCGSELILTEKISGNEENKDIFEKNSSQNKKTSSAKWKTIVFAAVIVLFFLILMITVITIRSNNISVGNVPKGKIIGQDNVWLCKQELTYNWSTNYWNSGNCINYIYDNAGYLTEEKITKKGSATRICYEYDKAGKIIKEYRLPRVEYTSGNEKYIPKMYYEHVYDADGKIKAKKMVSLKYNFFELIKQESPSDLPSFTYECDADGNIIREVEYKQNSYIILKCTVYVYDNNKLAESYIYDSNEMLESKTIYEYNSEGNETASYTYFSLDEISLNDNMDDREWILLSYTVNEYDANNNLGKKLFYDVDYDRDEDLLFKYIEYRYELMSIDILE